MESIALPGHPAAGQPTGGGPLSAEPALPLLAGRAIARLDDGAARLPGGRVHVRLHAPRDRRRAPRCLAVWRSLRLGRVPWPAVRPHQPGECRCLAAVALVAGGTDLASTDAPAHCCPGCCGRTATACRTQSGIVYEPDSNSDLCRLSHRPPIRLAPFPRGPAVIVGRRRVCGPGRCIGGSAVGAYPRADPPVGAQRRPHIPYGVILLASAGRPAECSAAQLWRAATDRDCCLRRRQRPAVGNHRADLLSTTPAGAFRSAPGWDWTASRPWPILASLLGSLLRGAGRRPIPRARRVG